MVTIYLDVRTTNQKMNVQEAQRHGLQVLMKSNYTAKRFLFTV